jgi:site-specific recombinase XerD
MAEHLDQLIDEFLASARARGLSPKTLREYRFPLREVLVPHCERHGLTELEQLTRASLDRLSTHLMDEGGKSGRPLSRHTIASYIRSINVFLSWAQAEGEAVAARAKAPKTNKRLIDVLSREEITAMEDAATAERDKLIVRVLADTGIRVGEVVNLTVRDLIERDRTHLLRVGGKTGERLVPIPRLYRRLLRYAQRGRPRDVASDRLFISLRRRPGGDYGPLTASGVEQVIQDLGARASISKRVYPHLLRHSYATWALTRGMNPIMLAHILGHASLAMIQNVYSHLTPTDAYEAMVRTLAEDDGPAAASVGPHLRPLPR